MKEAHLTVRLPGELADELDARAELRGLARSQVVREAVAAYLVGPSAPATARISARDLAQRWAHLPVLRDDERAQFSADVDAARAALPLPSDPWV